MLYNNLPVNENNISGKIFIGYVLEINDPANLGRKAVHIPTLLKSTVIGEKYIFCKEIINTYVRARDPLKQDIPYFSYGSYQPILPGTKVLVTFLNNSLESGYIIGVDATVKTPMSKDEWLVFKTPNNSEMYINDNNKTLHIKNAAGKTNLYMTDSDIYLQLNEQDNEGKSADALKARTYIQLGSDAITLKIGDTSYSFAENGFTLMSGNESTTYIEMSKDTININANKTLNLSSDEGNVNINGQYTYVTGYNELHLYGTDARFTGSQKAQISGNTVVMWGWMDAHLKGMHVGIDAWISYDLFTTMKNEINLALDNTFSGIKTNTSSVQANVTGINAESYSIKAQDGIILSNLGIGAGVSASLTASMNAISVTSKVMMMTINTGFLMNDPFTGAANQVLTSTIAGSANQSIGSFLTAGIGSSHLDDRNSVINAIAMRKKHEDNSKPSILPDKLSI